MSEYQPLWEYLKNDNHYSYKLFYLEIKNILVFNIVTSFLTYKK